MPRSSKKSPNLKASDSTTTPKSYGERVPFRKFFRARVRMSAADWGKVEESLRLEFRGEQRDRIQFFSDLYSSIGPLYSDAQSVLVKTARAEIDAWRKATGRLWRALSPTDVDLVDLMPEMKDGSTSTLAKLRLYGGGPAFTRIGRAIRYAKFDPDAFMAANTVASTSDYLPGYIRKSA